RAQQKLAPIRMRLLFRQRPVIARAAHLIAPGQPQSANEFFALTHNALILSYPPICRADGPPAAVGLTFFPVLASVPPLKPRRQISLILSALFVMAGGLAP